MKPDRNREAFSRPRSVQEYAKAEGLTACETYLFSKYVQLGGDILDLGVGGGRTAPFLAERAGRYIGIDYSMAMVEACRKKYPGQCFVCADATDLKRYQDQTFDVIVFAFNGIDAIPSDDRRIRCFKEVARLLRKNGLFILSSHNALSIGVIAKLKQSLFGGPPGNGSQVPVAGRAWEPGRGDANRLYNFIPKVLRAARVSFVRQIRRAHVDKIRRGTVYVYERAHGGIISFYSTPKYITEQARAVDLELLEIAGNSYPVETPAFATQWYYYVLQRR